MFPPELTTELHIRSQVYRLVPHPQFEGMPYGQEGREGTVYKLINGAGESSALKVFRPAFRKPSAMKLTELMANMKDQSGLRVWSRTILNPLEDMELLGQYPELLYSAHMPWIEGKTWSEFMLDREVITPERSLKLASVLVSTMAVLEQAGIAHADLSAANLLIVNANQESEDMSVELVDVEGMYAKQLEEPDNLPEGATGYTPPFLENTGIGVLNRIDLLAEFCLQRCWLGRVQTYVSMHGEIVILIRKKCSSLASDTPFFKQRLNDSMGPK